MIKEALIFTRIAVGTAIAAGGGSVLYQTFAGVSESQSIPLMEERARQLVPGYNPQEFRAKQQIIADFTKTAGKSIWTGKKSIEVPEDVTQAVSYIEKEQGTYNNGQNLVNDYHKEAGLPYLSKAIVKTLGSYAVFLMGISLLFGERKNKSTVSAKA